MSIFKRLSATVFASIDQMVGEIENHDAVIQATLKDMRKQVAEAKVRLNHIQREEQRLAEQIAEQTRQNQQWRNRARDVAQQDENKALECLRRSQQCQARIQRLQQNQVQYQHAATKLSHDITLSEQRLEEIKQKYMVMRARESSSAASQRIQDHTTINNQQLDECFDRWEVTLQQSEMCQDVYGETLDVLEQEFTSQEQEQALRDELADLLNKDKKGE